MVMRNDDMTNKVHNPKMIDRHVSRCKIVFSEKVNRIVYSTIQASYVNEIGFSEKAMLRVSGLCATFICLYYSCQCQNKLLK